MQHIEAKDVFISYRREDGATAARLLCDVLERRNISTFFDKETIEGDFHQSIKTHLVAARNVLVIVSAKMFSRYLLDNGSYDEKACLNDWVYEELRISLESGKNIIPVFVNGVTAFPKALPTNIEKIANFDALTLGHEHFDAELTKLIGRLHTPKNQLLNAYIQTLRELEDNDDPVPLMSSLIYSCLRLSSENEKVIEAFLKKTLKASWERSSSSDREALDILLDDATPRFLKYLSKNLALDDTGSSRRLKKNILAWLSHESNSLQKYEEGKKDHLDVVVNAFANVYKSVNDRQSITDQILEKLDVDLDGAKRSSWEIFFTVFLYIDIECFFEEMDKFIPEIEIKLIHSCLFNDDRGRKKELIERIISFANYEGEFDDIQRMPEGSA